MVGDQIRMRVWQGATEPDVWLTSATDTSVSAAAGVGLMGYLSRTVTNGTMTVSLDALEVRSGS